MIQSSDDSKAPDKHNKGLSQSVLCRRRCCLSELGLQFRQWDTELLGTSVALVLPFNGAIVLEIALLMVDGKRVNVRIGFDRGDFEFEHESIALRLEIGRVGFGPLLGLGVEICANGVDGFNLSFLSLNVVEFLGCSGSWVGVLPLPLFGATNICPNVLDQVTVKVKRDKYLLEDDQRQCTPSTPFCFE